MRLTSRQVGRGGTLRRAAQPLIQAPFKPTALQPDD